MYRYGKQRFVGKLHAVMFLDRKICRFRYQGEVGVHGSDHQIA